MSDQKGDSTAANSTCNPVFACSIDYFPLSQCDHIRMPNGKDLAVEGIFSRHTADGVESFKSDRATLQAALGAALSTNNALSELKSEELAASQSHYFVDPACIKQLLIFNASSRWFAYIQPKGNQNNPLRLIFNTRAAVESLAETVARQSGMIGFGDNRRLVYARPENFKLDQMNVSGRSVYCTLNFNDGSGEGCSYSFDSKKEARQAFETLKTTIGARLQGAPTPAGI